MTQQDIENSISASFDSLYICHTILSSSMDILVSGSFDSEPISMSVGENEDHVRYVLDKNREALEWISIEDWFKNNVDTAKVNEYQHIISASKSFNSLI